MSRIFEKKRLAVAVSAALTCSLSSMAYAADEVKEKEVKEETKDEAKEDDKKEDEKKDST